MTVRDEMAWIECSAVGSGVAKAKRCQDDTPCECCYERADSRLAALAAAGFKVLAREPTDSILSAIAGTYLVGAADRIAGNPQRAVPAARQAWEELFDAADPSGKVEKEKQP